MIFRSIFYICTVLDVSTLYLKFTVKNKQYCESSVRTINNIFAQLLPTKWTTAAHPFTIKSQVFL